MTGRSDKNKYEEAYKRHDQVQGILSWGVFAGGLLYRTKYLPNWLQGKPKTFFSIIWLSGITMKTCLYQGFKWWLGGTSKGKVEGIRFARHSMTSVIWLYLSSAVIWHQLITTISNLKTNQKNYYLKIQRLQNLIKDQLTSFHDELKMNSTTVSTKKEQQSFINDLVANSNKTPEATKQSFENLRKQVETYLKDIEKPRKTTLVEKLHNQTDSYWVLYLAMVSLFLFDCYTSYRFREKLQKDESTPTGNRNG